MADLTLKLNKNNEKKTWTEEFLAVTPRCNSMSFCSCRVSSFVLKEGFNVEMTCQIMLNCDI